MNRENAIRQKQKLRLGSKTFRSIFKSILMLLPVSIVIIVAAEVAFLHMMDRLAEDFESRTVSRVLNQVDLDFQQTYMVATRLKADETILSYVRKSERDYYSEWEVFDRFRAMNMCFPALAAEKKAEVSRRTNMPAVTTNGWRT